MEGRAVDHRISCRCRRVCRSSVHRTELGYPDTDLYCYFGTIRRTADDDVIGEIRNRRKRKNIIVFMTTSGGNPDCAYRIARCIQREYGLEEREGEGNNRFKRSDRNFSLFVDTFCVSAGTLIGLGATKLILSDFCELGPLDIQIRKPDEPTERDSGLTPAQALTSLERRTKSLFKEHFDQLRNDSDLSLTTRTSTEIAATITSGLFQPIYAQIDPMRLGEVERLMDVAKEYGQRLGKFNLKSSTLAKLLQGYPSHSFVIDRREARDLFKEVDRPKKSLRMIGEQLRSVAENPPRSQSPIHFFLGNEPSDPSDKPEEPDTEEANDESGTTGSGGDSAKARKRDGGAGKKRKGAK